MKNIILSALALIFLGSCVSTTHIHYSDPNYLSSNEFSSYEDITKNDPSDVVYSDNDTTNV